jgi:hypothetical protein
MTMGKPTALGRRILIYFATMTPPHGTATIARISNTLGVDAPLVTAEIVRLRADGHLEPKSFVLTSLATSLIADDVLGGEPGSVAIDDVEEHELGIVAAPDADGRPDPFASNRLAEQTRRVIAALTPAEKAVLAKRFGVA